MALSPSQLHLPFSFSVTRANCLKQLSLVRYITCHAPYPRLARKVLMLLLRWRNLPLQDNHHNQLDLNQYNPIHNHLHHRYHYH